MCKDPVDTSARLVGETRLVKLCLRSRLLKQEWQLRVLASFGQLGNVSKSVLNVLRKVPCTNIVVLIAKYRRYIGRSCCHTDETPIYLIVGISQESHPMRSGLVNAWWMVPVKLTWKHP